MTLIIVLLLLLVGILGSFIDRFPSPLFLVAVAIVLAAATPLPIAWWHILIVVLLAALCMLMDYLVPRWIKGIANFTSWGKWGAIIGSAITMILVPVVLTPDGHILPRLPWLIAAFLFLPFIFAAALECIRSRRIAGGLKSAATATLAFYATTLLKLVTAAFIIYLLLPL